MYDLEIVIMLTIVALFANHSTSKKKDEAK